MSNRIRIMFRGPNDGTFCHSGNRALRALEEHYLNSPRPSTKRGWIPEYQFKAGIKVHNTKKGILGDRYFLVDLPSGAKPEPVPVELRQNKVQLASWLWEHLPKELQGSCVLVVTREVRGANWRRSLANPSRIGNSPFCDKKTAPTSVEKALEGAFNKMAFVAAAIEHTKWQPPTMAKVQASKKEVYYGKYPIRKKKPYSWGLDDSEFYAGTEDPAPILPPACAPGAQAQLGKPLSKPPKPTSEKKRPRLGIWS